MSVYFEPIRVALEFFPLIAAVTLVPLAVLHWRRYGRVQRIRTLLLYLFIFYCVVALFLVILPLPKPGPGYSARYAWAAHPQLRPFMFVRRLLRTVPDSTWSSLPGIISLFGRTVFLQAILNFMLLFPLGLFLRYYFRARLIAALPVIIITTMTFELLQYSALLGLYPAPYRAFDVDDIILNTAGGLVGYLAAPVASRLVPVPLPQVSPNVTVVGYARRFLALVIDLLIGGTGILAVRIIIRLTGIAPVAVPAMFESGPLRFVPAPVGWGWLIDAAVLALLFVWAPAAWYGRTPGKALVRLMIVNEKSYSPGAVALLVRYAFQLLLPIVLLRFTLGDPVFRRSLGEWVDPFAVFLLMLLASIYLLPPLLRRDRRGVHEILSGTRTISTHVAAARRRQKSPRDPDGDRNETQRGPTRSRRRGSTRGN
ncbi:VanZ family protein [Salinispira pacifica]